MAVLKKISFHQTHEATDIRFLVVLLQVFQEKLHLRPEDYEELNLYPMLTHDDERMRHIRPLIRCTELNPMEKSNQNFINAFWKTIGLKTDCKLFAIQHEGTEMNYQQFIENAKDVLNFKIAENKEACINDDKFLVLFSLTSYVQKLFNEIAQNNLGQLIMARSSLRSIIEILIMMKYLIKKSSEMPNIWKKYQQYGLSKYKLVLLKVRDSNVEEDSHINPKILDAIVNEDISEEFIDIDLRYFDQLNIRDKSIEVGERDLYGLYYDYDSSFSHGLWGAIRECSTLSCNNPAHKFHSVPDSQDKQNCSDVLPDMFRVIKKVYKVLNEEYTLPSWFLELLSNG
jgi:hypothetical protein